MTGTIREHCHADRTDAEVGLTAKCGPQCQKQLSGPVDRGQTSVHHPLQTADRCNLGDCGFHAVKAAVRRLGLRHQVAAVKEGLTSTLDDPL